MKRERKKEEILSDRLRRKAIKIKEMLEAGGLSLGRRVHCYSKQKPDLLSEIGAIGLLSALSIGNRSYIYFGFNKSPSILFLGDGKGNCGSYSARLKEICYSCRQVGVSLLTIYCYYSIFQYKKKKLIFFLYDQTYFNNGCLFSI